MATRRRGLALGCLGVAVVLAGGGVGATAYARGQGWLAPTPVEPRCVVDSSSDGPIVLDPEQARLASVIAGRAVARGLPPRADTNAQAAADQESGIRNLDHGDLDSLGLFQQRPSQGWGTPAQVRDPVYATDRFYDALLKVPGWQTGDINDTAQAVQRSGHPQAYRKHETRARALAEVLTGRQWTSLSCTTLLPGRGDAAALARELGAVQPGVPATVSGSTVRLSARTPQQAWVLAYAAVAAAQRHGVRSVATNHLRWRAEWPSPSLWQRGAQEGETDVVVSLG